MDLAEALVVVVVASNRKQITLFLTSNKTIVVSLVYLRNWITDNEGEDATHLSCRLVTWKRDDKSSSCVLSVLQK